MRKAQTFSRCFPSDCPSFFFLPFFTIIWYYLCFSSLYIKMGITISLPHHSLLIYHWILTYYRWGRDSCLKQIQVHYILVFSPSNTGTNSSASFCGSDSVRKMWNVKERYLVPCWWANQRNYQDYYFVSFILIVLQPLWAVVVVFFSCQNKPTEGGN